MARTIGFGRSGAGKSWYFGKYLEDAVPKFDYAVHFDMEDEEQGLSVKDDPVFKSFYVDDEFYNSRVEYKGKEMPLTSAVILHNGKVRVVPDNLTPSEQRELFAQISKLAMEIGKAGHNIHLSADEAHNILPDIDDSLDDRIVRMLTGGRKKGVEWAFFTQRPSNLHEEAWSQANYGIYFSLTKDVDLARVENSSNIPAYRLLPEMSPRRFYIEDLDNGDIRFVSTDNMDREHPHFAEDDGVADDVLESAAEAGEEVEESI